MQAVAGVPERHVVGAPHAEPEPYKLPDKFDDMSQAVGYYRDEWDGEDTASQTPSFGTACGTLRAA